MSQPIAGIFMRGTVYDWYVIPFLVAFVLATFAAHYWRFFVRWLGGIRGRDWTAVSAVIDVVSIVQQTVQSDHGEHVIGYLAAACSTKKQALRPGRRPTRAAPLWST